MWDCLEANIRTTLDKMCPIRTLTVPESKPAWLNNDIILLMHKRDKMFRLARHRNKPVSWRKTVFLRNRVEMAIKSSKREKIHS